MRRFYVIIILTVVAIGCGKKNKIREAEIKANELLEDIASGDAYNSFPEKYFPKDQTVEILTALKDNCDFKNRKGNFINDFSEVHNTTERISFIYEYYLKCDSIRFIISYNLSDSIELCEFKLEPLEKENSMIRFPEKQLAH